MPKNFNNPTARRIGNSRKEVKRKWDTRELTLLGIAIAVAVANGVGLYVNTVGYNKTIKLRFYNGDDTSEGFIEMDQSLLDELTFLLEEGVNSKVADEFFALVGQSGAERPSKGREK